MKIGMIGLGRMGMNMVRRLLQGGHEVVAYNRSPEKAEEIAKEGAVAAFSVSDLAEKLPAPRVAWTMLPAGAAVEDHLLQLKEILSPEDIVIDGGNTYFKDDIRRAEMLGEKGIGFMDVGVSGGIWGLKVGYCLMIGGPEETYRYLEPVFKSLAPKEGYLYCGPNGAGHFVKMIHNGIEYGMMQAYGEGFQILEASPYAKTINYAQVAHLWNQGSVVRSWLLELAEAAFSKDGKLADISGYVEDSGEGRWTVNQAIETGVPAPVITLSLMNRFRSRDKDSFSDRVVAALRREFGGHAVVTSEKK
ncbi:MAG: 6-phosphogluconate dehydrogenase (decarboxylating) [Deltaproteobacteria bacterium HGW-Deltaproteobacteria-15]|nr:MAG: 6-phosphogluconate dehydrogenase (decarboxylating) [Deltaproteobacteria bacterium HGW-Deltaproteobacteria-15]